MNRIVFAVIGDLGTWGDGGTEDVGGSGAGGEASMDEAIERGRSRNQTAPDASPAMTVVALTAMTLWLGRTWLADYASLLSHYNPDTIPAAFRPLWTTAATGCG